MGLSADFRLLDRLPATAAAQTTAGTFSRRTEFMQRARSLRADRIRYFAKRDKIARNCLAAGGRISRLGGLIKTDDYLAGRHLTGAASN